MKVSAVESKMPEVLPHLKPQRGFGEMAQPILQACSCQGHAKPRGHVFGGLAPANEQPVQRRAVRRGGLPERLQVGIERLSGLPMDDVRVHYNSPHPARVDALAYTQGNQIHVGRGAEQHLGHEAWHVVQQKQQRVRPTMRVAGRRVNDNESLEREAEVMGSRAMSEGWANTMIRPGAAAAVGRMEAAPPLQRARRKRNRQPRYKDPVKKPEIRYGGIDSPRDEVRRKMNIPDQHFHDPVVGVPREFLEPATEGSLEESLKKLPRAYGNHPDVRRLIGSERIALIKK
jgi:hypothetical protein